MGGRGVGGQHAVVSPVDSPLTLSLYACLYLQGNEGLPGLPGERGLKGEPATPEVLQGPEGELFTPVAGLHLLCFVDHMIVVYTLLTC